MIFPEKNEKRIPKTLNECIKPNSTVYELNLWADRLENWGGILLVILIVVGITLTIVETVSLIDVNESMIFPTLISSIITWGLYAFVEYCAYHAIALILRALASITHHSMITANVALFENSQASDSESKKHPTPRVSGGKWDCPECGNTLPYDVVRCKCGYEKQV